jgi:cytochrome c-type biogenesis protein CcmH/NrfG
MTKYNKLKKYLYILLAIVIVAASGYGAFRHFNKQKNPADYSLQDLNKLTDQQRIKALEDQVNELQAETQQLTKDAAEDVKYPIYIKLAEAQIALGKFKEALDSLNAIPQEPKLKNTRMLVDYAQAYKGAGDAAKALDSANRALAVDDTNATAWLILLESPSKYDNTQMNNLYREAIAKTKSNLDIIISYAHFSERIGDKATAIAAWETARNINPDKAADYEKEMARLKE